jgi:hypothetical protein
VVFFIIISKAAKAIFIFNNLCLGIKSLAIVYIYIAYWNINYSANLRSRASVKCVANAIVIKVKLAWLWECKAKQFIYLHLLELSYIAFI